MPRNTIRPQWDHGRPRKEDARTAVPGIDQWEALREFSDPTKTYADFKAYLFELYNLNITRYTLRDL